MRIVLVRQISQGFFFAVFLWFCVVTTFGEQWWQLRGWPINWFFQLDPLTAIGTVLTTGKLYAPLLWALATMILTIVFGRFFCGWVCPFGALHHFVGFLGSSTRNTSERIHRNRYRKAQGIKYLVLIFLLLSALVPPGMNSLQTGLLDPIALLTRSVNLVLLPIMDRLTHTVSVTPRFYEHAWLILTIFLAVVFLNLLIPRFYCRFICPLGALLAIPARLSLWRIGKISSPCRDCRTCEAGCEGGCEPGGTIRTSECMLCFNCRDDCKDQLIGYRPRRSAAGELPNPDISRRGFVIAALSGVFAVPAIRLGNKLGANYYPTLIRPPGALPEPQFLQRCAKCGQCMRVCPTNVLQPAGIEPGLEALWTPTLNNRIGSSGCQLNCVACGHVCPTAAIRPISLEEKLGLAEFAPKGPLKIGTAFIDRGRCLPWAMDSPCIVCQENCPVSPKAIYTRPFFSTLRNATFMVALADQTAVQVSEGSLTPHAFATGDYYCGITDQADNEPRQIIANTQNVITISKDNIWKNPPAARQRIDILIRLQRPYIDIEKCTGCGICEHECPVSGKRAIRVSAENESRSSARKLRI